eukprot:9405784-Prorocentrum_lima.AAC.1
MASSSSSLAARTGEAGGGWGDLVAQLLGEEVVVSHFALVSYHPQVLPPMAAALAAPLLSS